jgi:hypothetical protein
VRHQYGGFMTFLFHLKTEVTPDGPPLRLENAFLISDYVPSKYQPETPGGAMKNLAKTVSIFDAVINGTFRPVPPDY